MIYLSCILHPENRGQIKLQFNMCLGFWYLNPYSAKSLGDRLYANLHKMPGNSANHFVYFWSHKTLPYTHLEATSYIPQQGQSLHIWITALSTTDCYKNKYTIQFLWVACISRFATAILSGETELPLCTIRVKFDSRTDFVIYEYFTFFKN